MSACCVGRCASDKPPIDPNYRRIFWAALAVNLAMFSWKLPPAGPPGLRRFWLNAVDFMGDVANYGVSLFILSLAAIWRSRTALVKGITMGGYGLLVLGATAWHVATGTVSKAETMGLVGFLALAANSLVALLPFAYRNGDSNMRPVWLCNRNDMIGNAAVLLAALGVFGTGSGWPDIIVAAVMGALGLTAARTVIAQARSEMQPATAPVTIELKRK